MFIINWNNILIYHITDFYRERFKIYDISVTKLIQMYIYLLIISICILHKYIFNKYVDESLTSIQNLQTLFSLFLSLCAL